MADLRTLSCQPASERDFIGKIATLRSFGPRWTIRAIIQGHEMRNKFLCPAVVFHVRERGRVRTWRDIPSINDPAMIRAPGSAAAFRGESTRPSGTSGNSPGYRNRYSLVGIECNIDSLSVPSPYGGAKSAIYPTWLARAPSRNRHRVSRRPVCYRKPSPPTNARPEMN
jgi:hypothetical protein